MSLGAGPRPRTPSTASCASRGLRSTSPWLAPWTPTRSPRWSPPTPACASCWSTPHDRNVGVAVGQFEIGPSDQHRLQVGDGVLRRRSVGPRAGAALDGRDQVLGVLRIGDDRLPGSRGSPLTHLCCGGILRVRRDRHASRLPPGSRACRTTPLVPGSRTGSRLVSRVAASPRVRQSHAPDRPPTATCCGGRSAGHRPVQRRDRRAPLRRPICGHRTRESRYKREANG